MTTPKPPLWKAMDDAYVSHMTSEGCIDIPERIGYAAELRAIAVWLFPEEPEPDCCDRAIRLRWLERQRLRLELLAEADRAEAGE